MARYKVVRNFVEPTSGGGVINGRIGETVELTAAQAERLNGLIEPVAVKKAARTRKSD